MEKGTQSNAKKLTKTDVYSVSYRIYLYYPDIPVFRS